MKLCPECQRDLEHQTYKVFHCWKCPDGHGTLYPKGELENIVRAVSGLGEMELPIWSDHKRYSVVPSSMISPESREPLMEIRDRSYMHLMVYADPETHSLWLHTGEEEKLIEHIEANYQPDSVSAYLVLAAEEAASLFDDEQPLAEATGHMVIALKLLGERILRAIPNIVF